MAIVQSTNNGLVTTKSDAGKYIIRDDGTQYENAVDPVGSGRTYTESEISIPTEPSEGDLGA